MKKITFSILPILLVPSILVGCGKEEPPSPPDSVSLDNRLNGEADFEISEKVEKELSTNNRTTEENEEDLKKSESSYTPPEGADRFIDSSKKIKNYEFLTEAGNRTFAQGISVNLITESLSSVKLSESTIDESVFNGTMKINYTDDSFSEFSISVGHEGKKSFFCPVDNPEELYEVPPNITNYFIDFLGM